MDNHAAESHDGSKGGCQVIVYLFLAAMMTAGAWAIIFKVLA